MDVHVNLSGLLGAVVLICALPACSESHDVSGDGLALVGGDGGEGGEGGNRGSAGVGAGRGGATSAAGRGGSGSCSDCKDGSLIGIPIPACCTASNKCGFDLSSLGLGGCEESNSPGAVNAGCPAQTIGGFLSFQGCCRPDKTCGALDTLLGLGCVSTGDQAQSCQP